MPPSKVARRVERLLTLVPYVVRHPGVSLEELSRLFGVDESDLARDLNLLFMTGLPPYGPGDLIDVEIEEGKVWIRMADYFSRPLRLTPAEALALSLRAVAVLGSPGLPEADALRSALEKLRASLGDRLEPLPVDAAEGGKPSGPLAAVRRAAARHERIEIDYYSAGRDEVTTRRIDPEQVFSAIGNWYVAAWCHRVKGERLFRVDRIHEVRPTGERFEPRGLAGVGRPLYSPSEEDIRVRLRLGPGARWVAEYHETEEEREADGALEVTLPTTDLAWVAKLVLRLGGEAEVLEPSELRELARRLAGETLALYR